MTVRVEQTFPLSMLISHCCGRNGDHSLNLAELTLENVYLYFIQDDSTADIGPRVEVSIEGTFSGNGL